MCSRCHKRVAVIFMRRMDGGEEKQEGFCVKCAKDLGLPIENMLGDIYNKMGISPEQMENMENELADAMNEGEDGGAPAIDFPKLFKDSGFMDAIKSVADNLPAAQSGEPNIVPMHPFCPCQSRLEAA